MLHHSQSLPCPSPRLPGRSTVHSSSSTSTTSSSGSSSGSLQGQAEEEEEGGSFRIRFENDPLSLSTTTTSSSSRSGTGDGCGGEKRHAAWRESAKYGDEGEHGPPGFLPGAHEQQKRGQRHRSFKRTKISDDCLPQQQQQQQQPEQLMQQQQQELQQQQLQQQQQAEAWQAWLTLSEEGGELAQLCDEEPFLLESHARLLEDSSGTGGRELVRQCAIECACVLKM